MHFKGLYLCFCLCVPLLRFLSVFSFFLMHLVSLFKINDTFVGCFVSFLVSSSVACHRLCPLTARPVPNRESRNEPVSHVRIILQATVCLTWGASVPVRILNSTLGLCTMDRQL